ncbi:MAG: acyl-CoA thioesterase [Steroidobacteraceae bacterium]
MDQRVTDLLKLLELERLEVNLFRGQSRDIGSPQVFGGQVLGQALTAASATVEKRIVHSLHAYFLRRGDFTAPIIYQVDRSRDGGSFSSRRVAAVQFGEPIFTMAASFQIVETGLDHQMEMPAVPPPEVLEDAMYYGKKYLAKVPERIQKRFETAVPFEFRFVEVPGFVNTEKREAVAHIWFRVIDRIPSDDENLHRCILAYVSDYNLLGTAVLPHGIALFDPCLITASIDHGMWFHRPVRVDEWLLYATDSPSASGARGFTRGSIFTRDGQLVASAAQEGLIRVVQPKT